MNGRLRSKTSSFRFERQSFSFSFFRVEKESIIGQENVWFLHVHKNFSSIPFFFFCVSAQSFATKMQNEQKKKTVSSTENMTDYRFNSLHVLSDSQEHDANKEQVPKRNEKVIAANPKMSLVHAHVLKQTFLARRVTTKELRARMLNVNRNICECLSLAAFQKSQTHAIKQIFYNLKVSFQNGKREKMTKKEITTAQK